MGASNEASAAWDPKDGPPPLRFPLAVEGRNLGLLVLSGAPEPLKAGEKRVLLAFGNELAQVLERDRLLAAAEEAEELRQTEAARRALFGTVSHELRSPLAAIKASVTDLLTEDASPSPEYRREALVAVNNESDRLDRLITNLLDMSRIDAGSLRSRIQICDLSDTVASCAERIRGWFPGLEISIRVPDDASLVQADPVFLERVVSNLLDNAGKASAPGPVEVEVEAGRERVTVRVIDHGPGIPESARELIFHPFYGLDQRNSRTRSRVGSGDLPGVPRRNGGRDLGREHAGGRSDPGFFTGSRGVDGVSGRILVVDDEIQIRRALQRALSARGYSVESAADGEAALMGAQVFQPDLIVLDLNLPGMSGLEVCERIRSSSQVPVLILSVRSDESDKVTALDLGADDYLTKPFGIDELLARVRALLRRMGAPDGARAPGTESMTSRSTWNNSVSSAPANGCTLRRPSGRCSSRSAQHPGRLLTHRWLLEQVWGHGVWRQRGDLQSLRQPAAPQDRARPQPSGLPDHGPRSRLPVGGAPRRRFCPGGASVISDITLVQQSGRSTVEAGIRSPDRTIRFSPHPPSHQYTNDRVHEIDRETGG